MLFLLCWFCFLPCMMFSPAPTGRQECDAETGSKSLSLVFRQRQFSPIRAHGPIGKRECACGWDGWGRWQDHYCPRIDQGSSGTILGVNLVYVLRINI